MNTKLGTVLHSSDFESPFDAILNDAHEKSISLYESFRKEYPERLSHRTLHVQFIENSDLNAEARVIENSDVITIYRGAIERIYGTSLGLMSTPLFLPEIGNASSELVSDDLATDGFPMMPLLRTDDATQQVVTLLPKDPQRLVFAITLADFAIEFLLFHEMGHLLGGHCDVIGAQTYISERDQQDASFDNLPFRQIIECEADAFACRVTSDLHLMQKMADHPVSKPEMMSQSEFAVFTHITAIRIVLRLLYPYSDTGAFDSQQDYPHSAVRDCAVSSHAMANAIYAGDIEAGSAENIFSASAGSLEKTWTELRLPGQFSRTSDALAEVDKAFWHLYTRVRAHSDKLNSMARVHRFWGEWALPVEDDKSTGGIRENPSKKSS